MKKNIILCCLSIILICAISNSTLANPKINGFYSAAWGQYNSGVSGESPYFRPIFSAFINFNQASDNQKFKSKATFLLKETSGAPDLDISNVSVGYQVTDALTVALGEADPRIAYGFGRGAGIMFGGPLKYDLEASYANGKAFGLHATYKFSKNLMAHFGLLSEDKFYAPTPGPPPSLLNAGGSGMHVSVGGKAGPVDYRAAYTTGTTDPGGSSAALSSNGLMVAGKYNLGKTMSISLDYGAKTVGGATSDTNTSSMGLQIRANKIGPGNIIITYGTATVGTADPTTHIDLAYDAFIRDGKSKMQAFYLMKNKPAAGPSAAATESMIGVLFAIFY